MLRGPIALAALATLVLVAAASALADTNLPDQPGEPQVICISNSSSVKTPEGGYRRLPHSCNFHANGRPAAAAYMVMMRHVKWSSWGGEFALGSGKELVNMVGPVPAKVKLSGVRHVCGHLIYSQAQFKGKKGGWSDPMQLDRRLASTSCG